MTELNPDPASKQSGSRRFLPLLLLLFVGSGCSALIYEIVWFQLLQLVIGSSAVSIAVLLGTFMGGMCLGSLALSRVISTRQHPLRVYALLELGIGLCGIVVLFVIPNAGRFYTSNAMHGMLGILLRGIVCAICLLPPTLLMGATLPAIARWIETTPRGVSWLGFFYGSNIAGAVFGCLLAGFYLLRVHDMAFATYVAAAINAAVAVVGLALAANTLHVPQQSEARNQKSEITPAPAVGRVYLAIALSGLTALGAEVVWTRLLSLMLGATVYAFSIILAVFLLGLGIGSSIGSLLSRGCTSPRAALGWCQLFLTAAITWTAFMIAQSLPYWPVEPSLTTDAWLHFQLDLARCLWAILPPAILWGASFPLALAAVASPGQDAGRLVGRVYAANTIGAIIGAISFSVFLIARLGTQSCQQLLIGLASLAALVMFFPRVTGTPRSIGTAVALVIGIPLAGLMLGGAVAPIPWRLVAYGRHMPTRMDESDLLYVGEGMNSSVAVSKMRSDGVRNFHVSGKVEASSEPQDMRLQRMLGHLPALIHPQPRSVLIVGCGAGVTAGSFVVHPSIQKIVICEIEPLIPRVVSRYFTNENYSVVSDPRVTIIYDDARHYVLTTKDKFDIITSDPIHPWVKGAATLYTEEYFELCKQHLNPGGVITQWVPLYESTLPVVKSEIATFMKAFPHGTIWGNDIGGKGYDVVLLGQDGATKINVDEMQQRLERPDEARVAASLRNVEFPSALSLLETYAGQGPDLTAWMQDAEINRDRNLRLQYLAGMGVDFSNSALIYDDILAYCRYPDEIFTASDRAKAALKKVLDKSKTSP